MGSASGKKQDLSLPNNRYLSVPVVRRFQLQELVTRNDIVPFALWEYCARSAQGKKDLVRAERLKSQRGVGEEPTEERRRWKRQIFRAPRAKERKWMERHQRAIKPFFRSPLFLSSPSSSNPFDRVILLSSYTSVSFIAAECGAFLSGIQILCEEVRSTFESAATDDSGEEHRWRE